MKCPYCGEEIMAAAKKCRYCGEWLTRKDEKETKGTALEQHEPMTQANVAKPVPSIEQQKEAPLGIKMSKPAIFTILGVSALISFINMLYEAGLFNMIMDSDWAETFVLGESLILILSSVIFMIVNINKGNITMTCLRWWIAVEILCLCAPFSTISPSFIVDNYYPENIVVTVLATTVLGEIFFFSTSKLSKKTIISLYTYGSIFYILFSICCIIFYF